MSMLKQANTILEEFLMLNENVVKLLKASMWDLATCENGEPNVVPVAFKDVTEDGKLKKIKGEFRSNGVANDISHERGVISMARTNVKDSASSQFFICHADSKFLDGEYAAFGKVTDGYDVLDAVADVPVVYGPSGEKTTPMTPVVIKSVTEIE